MSGFSVTFARYHAHPPEEDVCEPDEIGYIVQDVTLREALQAIAVRPEWAKASSADSWPVTNPRWFSFDNVNEGTREEIEDGIHEDRSLHLPASMSPASRRRLARFLGLKVATLQSNESSTSQ